MITTTTLSVRVPLSIASAINRIVSELAQDFERQVTRNEVLGAALAMYVADCDEAQLLVKHWIS